jgi:hypothetical protein
MTGDRPPVRRRTLLSGTWLSGIEARSIEISGRLDPAPARALAGPGLPLREDERGAEIELLAFRMTGLAPDAAPWMGMDYGEILFRLGVEHAGAPAWLAVTCLLDRAAVASFAAALIRYPTTRARRIDIESGPTTWRIDAESHRGRALRATLAPDAAPPPAPAPLRPVLVRAKGRLLRVPWDEIPAPHRAHAAAAVEPGPLELDALGAHARWTSAVLHERRLHRCGIAGPV